jgi:hypothetical protein
MKLKNNGVKYSTNEIKTFKLLSKRRKSTADLVNGYYGKNVVFNGRKIMIGMLRSLKRKMAANKEPFHIQSTERHGPYSMEFWLETK